MFLTPVLYPPPVRWPFYLINLCNPLSPLLAASQDLIAEGFLTKPEMFATEACIFSTALSPGWLACLSYHHPACPWLRLAELLAVSTDTIVRIEGVSKKFLPLL